MEVLDKRAILGACIISEKGGHSISACEKVRKCCMKGLPRRTGSLLCNRCSLEKKTKRKACMSYVGVSIWHSILDTTCEIYCRSIVI